MSVARERGVIPARCTFCADALLIQPIPATYVEPARGFCECAPASDSWRARLAEVMTGSTVGNISTGLVLVNLVLMCMPYDGMSDEYADGLENAATVISWLFIFEMLLHTWRCSLPLGRELGLRRRRLQHRQSPR